MSDPSSSPYRPREFWQERLSENFDLRGTGHPGLSAEYNRLCYALRAGVLDRLCAKHHVRVAGRNVLDGGCGSGFFVEHFLERGAAVTGVDLTEVSARELAKKFPTARFEVGDLSEWRPQAKYDLVSCFDVLFHITDDERWDRALTNLTDAVKPGGWFVFTEMFLPGKRRDAAHNVARGWAAYRPALMARGLSVLDDMPTHHFMNNELGPLRFLNRFPQMLFRIDLALLTTGAFASRPPNRMILCRRPDGVPEAS
jgi:2-polyprenyl-3-methyl-5-hydroxy-6-metoxy-1,4-benzoquinol methylase